MQEIGESIWVQKENTAIKGAIEYPSESILDIGVNREWMKGF